MDAVIEALLLLAIFGLLTVLGTRELKSSVARAAVPVPRRSKTITEDDAA